MSVPVSLDTPTRPLTASQSRKLDKLADQGAGAVTVGWDDRLGGPVIQLRAFPSGRWVIDRRGQVRAQ